MGDCVQYNTDEGYAQYERLSQSPVAARMETQPNCLAVLRLATAKPNGEDQPGQLASSQRRARAGRSEAIRRRAGSRRRMESWMQSS